VLFNQVRESAAPEVGGGTPRAFRSRAMTRRPSPRRVYAPKMPRTTSASGWSRTRTTRSPRAFQRPGSSRTTPPSAPRLRRRTRRAGPSPSTSLPARTRRLARGAEPARSPRRADMALGRRLSC